MEEINKKIGLRIKFYREHFGLTQKELATKLGLKSDAAIANYESGLAVPKDGTKVKMCEIFSCTLDELFGRFDVDENVNLKLDQALIKIPILGSIPAGEPLFEESNIIGKLPIIPEMYNLNTAEGLFFLQVHGESMNKVVQDGAYVLVKQQDFASNNDTVVAQINLDEVTLKKYKQIDNSIISLEPESTYETYKPYIINLQDNKCTINGNTKDLIDFKIVGIVIGDFKNWIKKY